MTVDVLLAGFWLFINDVGGHAELGDPMHRSGSDLEFGALMARPINGGVDRLIVITFGG